MTTISKSLHIYEHNDQTVLSNGQNHAYVEATPSPWLREVFWDRKQLVIQMNFGHASLDVCCFADSHSLVEIKPRTLTPYITNGVVSKPVSSYVPLPTEAVNPRAAGHPLGKIEPLESKREALTPDPNQMAAGPLASPVVTTLPSIPVPAASPNAGHVPLQQNFGTTPKSEPAVPSSARQAASELDTPPPKRTKTLEAVPLRVDVATS